MSFKKAERKGNKLKICITGPSGSGKTLSALLLAKGLGGKIALIDTENGSASLYAGRPGVPEFDTMDLSPPYTTQKYVDAIKLAINSGYDILIIDSGTHQWAGEGGILSQKEKLDQRPNSNSFTNWGKLTPEQEFFKSNILHANIHLIMTLRSKQEYALNQEPGQKAKVQKLGMAPIQREGMEYEFTTVFDVDMTHNATASKDRTGIYDGKYFVLNEKTGEEFKKWIGENKEEQPKTQLGAPESTVIENEEVLDPSLVIIPGAFKGRSIEHLEKTSCDHVLNSFAKLFKEDQAKYSTEPYKIMVANVRQRRSELEGSQGDFAKFNQPTSVIQPRVQ